MSSWKVECFNFSMVGANSASINTLGREE